MTREEFIARIVIAGYGGWMANPALEGPVSWEWHVKQANIVADALYGQAKQVESDEMLELQNLSKSFVILWDRFNFFRADASSHVPHHLLEIADEALELSTGTYNECRRVLRGEDDNAS